MTNALSRASKDSHGLLFVLSVPHFAFLDQLKPELAIHPEFIELKWNIRGNSTSMSNYIVTQDFILYKNRIWLPNGLNFILSLLMEFHTSPTGGHMGIKKTLPRLGENFVWDTICNDIWQFIASYLDCQHTKYEARKPTGLLYHLLAPTMGRPFIGLHCGFSFLSWKHYHLGGSW